jgi:hypothetical protein
MRPERSLYLAFAQFLLEQENTDLTGGLKGFPKYDTFGVGHERVGHCLDPLRVLCCDAWLEWTGPGELREEIRVSPPEWK